MPRGQLLDPRDQARIVGHIAERQIILDRADVGHAPHQRMREQPLQFRRERHRTIGQFDIMERLYPQPVAREEQALSPSIVEREREHAVEPVEHRRPPRCPAVKQNLGIARGDEHRAQRLQLGAQLGEIVDLAIVGDGQRAVLARHRLRRARNVDDRQAPMPEPDPRRGPHARAVGPAMRLRVGHRLNPRGVDRLGGRGIIETGDSAH